MDTANEQPDSLSNNENLPPHEAETPEAGAIATTPIGSTPKESVPTESTPVAANPSESTSLESILPSYDSYRITNNTDPHTAPRALRTVVPLREHTVGEIITSAFRLLKFNPVAYILFPAILTLAVIALIVIISAGSGTSILTTLDLADLDTTNTGFAAGASLIGGAALSINICIILEILIIYIASTRFTINSIRGIKLSLRDAFHLPLPRLGWNFLRYIGLYAIYYLAFIIGGGILFAILIATGGSFTATDFTSNIADSIFLTLLCLLLIFFSIRLSVAGPALVAEDIGPLAAIQRSWKLTKNYFWRLLGVVALTAILLIAATLVIIISFSVIIIAIDSSVATLISFFAILLITMAVFTPFSMAVTNMMYVNMRFAKENFAQQIIDTLPQNN